MNPLRVSVEPFFGVSVESSGVCVEAFGVVCVEPFSGPTSLATVDPELLRPVVSIVPSIVSSSSPGSGDVSAAALSYATAGTPRA